MELQVSELTVVVFVCPIDEKLNLTSSEMAAPITGVTVSLKVHTILEAKLFFHVMV